MALIHLGNAPLDFLVIVGLSRPAECKVIGHALKESLISAVERPSYSTLKNEVRHRMWNQALVVCDESFDDRRPHAGIELAEWIQQEKERRGYGEWPKVIVRLRVPSPRLLARIQLAGADFVCSDTRDAHAVLLTKILGLRDDLERSFCYAPVLLNRHGHLGERMNLYCTDAESHEGFRVLYGLRDRIVTSLGSPHVAFLDWKLKRPFPEEDWQIVEGINSSSFHRGILRAHEFIITALPMIVSRTREALGDCLSFFGLGLRGSYFLPEAEKLSQRYRFQGVSKTIHVCIND